MAVTAPDRRLSSHPHYGKRRLNAFVGNALCTEIMLASRTASPGGPAQNRGLSSGIGFRRALLTFFQEGGLFGRDVGRGDGQDTLVSPTGEQIELTFQGSALAGGMLGVQVFVVEIRGHHTGSLAGERAVCPGANDTLHVDARSIHENREVVIDGELGEGADFLKGLTGNGTTVAPGSKIRQQSGFAREDHDLAGFDFRRHTKRLFDQTCEANWRIGCRRADRQEQEQEYQKPHRNEITREGSGEGVN